MYYRSVQKFTAQEASELKIQPLVDWIDVKKSQQQRLFTLFLICSVILHLCFLFYQKNKPIILGAAPISDAPISLKINLSKPVIIPRKEPLKKPIKKNPLKKKEKVAEVKPVEEIVKKDEPVAQTQQSTTRPFDSVIANYIQPQYPRMAIRRGLTGIVVLTLWIKNNGEVKKVELTKSSGHESLDQSALDAVKKWRFKDMNSLSQNLYKVEKRIVYQIN
jgi:TonB family protein